MHKQICFIQLIHYIENNFVRLMIKKKHKNKTYSLYLALKKALL